MVSTIESELKVVFCEEKRTLYERKRKKERGGKERERKKPRDKGDHKTDRSIRRKAHSSVPAQTNREPDPLVWCKFHSSIFGTGTYCCCDIWSVSYSHISFSHFLVSFFQLWPFCLLVAPAITVKKWMLCFIFSSLNIKPRRTQRHKYI